MDSTAQTCILKEMGDLVVDWADSKNIPGAEVLFVSYKTDEWNQFGKSQLEEVWVGTIFIEHCAVDNIVSQVLNHRNSVLCFHLAINILPIWKH